MATAAAQRLSVSLAAFADRLYSLTQPHAESFQVGSTFPPKHGSAKKALLIPHRNDRSLNLDWSVSFPHTELLFHTHVQSGLTQYYTCCFMV